MEQYPLAFTGEEVNNILINSKNLNINRQINLFVTNSFLNAINNLINGNSGEETIDVTDGNFLNPLNHILGAGTINSIEETDYIISLRNFFAEIYNGYNLQTIGNLFILSVTDVNIGINKNNRAYIQKLPFITTNKNLKSILDSNYSNFKIYFDLRNIVTNDSIFSNITDEYYLCIAPNKSGNQLTLTVEKKIDSIKLDDLKSLIPSLNLSDFLKVKAQSYTISDYISNDSRNYLEKLEFNNLKYLIGTYNSTNFKMKLLSFSKSSGLCNLVFLTNIKLDDSNNFIPNQIFLYTITLTYNNKKLNAINWNYSNL